MRTAPSQEDREDELSGERNQMCEAFKKKKKRTGYFHVA